MALAVNGFFLLGKNSKRLNFQNIFVSLIETKFTWGKKIFRKHARHFLFPNRLMKAV
jgi:hypothetical protein